MNGNALNAVVSVVSLASLLALWALYESYKVEKLRQEMFALRDALFDAAASGLVAFDDPAYGMLRATMNGFIRFGHRLSALRILLWILIAKPRQGSPVPSGFHEEWIQHLDALAPEARRELKAYRAKMNWLVFARAFGPVISAAVMFMAGRTVAAKKAVERLRVRFRKEIDTIDRVALAEGCA